MNIINAKNKLQERYKDKPGFVGTYIRYGFDENQKMAYQKLCLVVNHHDSEISKDFTENSVWAGWPIVIQVDSHPDASDFWSSLNMQRESKCEVVKLLV